MADRVLEANELSFAYSGSRTLFDGLSFGLDRGEIFVILGANGAGKSTLLSILSGLLRPCRGSVSLNGRSIASLSPKQTARELGFVPQVHENAFGFSVRDYLVMGRAMYLDFGRQPGREEYERADAVMERLNIVKLAEKSYNELSGGERQQVTIGRALVQDAGIILLDEPTNHLDFGNQQQILELILSLSEEGRTVLLTTHQPDHAIILGGRVGVLGAGGDFETGTAEEMITQEKMSRLYGIDLRVFESDKLGRRICAYAPMKGGR